MRVEGNGLEIGGLPGDWPEDFSHENGNYENRCFSCGELFRGHKRRVQCKRHLIKKDSDDDDSAT